MALELAGKKTSCKDHFMLTFKKLNKKQRQDTSRQQNKSLYFKKNSSSLFSHQRQLCKGDSKTSNTLNPSHWCPELPHGSLGTPELCP